MSHTSKILKSQYVSSSATSYPSMNNAEYSCVTFSSPLSIRNIIPFVMPMLDSMEHTNQNIARLMAMAFSPSIPTIHTHKALMTHVPPQRNNAITWIRMEQKPAHHQKQRLSSRKLVPSSLHPACSSFKANESNSDVHTRSSKYPIPKLCNILDASRSTFEASTLPLILRSPQ